MGDLLLCKESQAIRGIQSRRDRNNRGKIVILSNILTWKSYKSGINCWQQPRFLSTFKRRFRYSWSRY